MIYEDLQHLEDLREVGIAIAQYAESIAGDGRFEASGSRWVIRPNNFVTLEPHWKRVINISISLRGNPVEFASLPELPLKQGMAGYSECLVTSASQLAAATLYIRRAAELYERGRSREQKAQQLLET